MIQHTIQSPQQKTQVLDHLHHHTEALNQAAGKQAAIVVLVVITKKRRSSNLKPNNNWPPLQQSANEQFIDSLTTDAPHLQFWRDF